MRWKKNIWNNAAVNVLLLLCFSVYASLDNCDEFEVCLGEGQWTEDA